MESDPPWNPLAIMFSMYGSRISSKLLFKYPFETARYSHSSLLTYKQLTPSTFHLNHLSSNKGNDMESELDNDIVRDETEQYLGFSDETLAQISSPGNSKICGQKFDVKINGLRFVGFPLMLEEDNIEDNIFFKEQFKVPSPKPEKCCTSESVDGSDIVVISFNVVFVLKTTADYSVVECYQQLASKLGIGLRFEEKRDSYITRQTRTMLQIHDDETDLSNEKIYCKILENSTLAKNFQYVFDSLQDTGIINLSLNDNLFISFCLYHKVHNSFFVSENCKPVCVSTIEDCLNKIQPFHGLLVYDIKDVWASLNDYCSMSIVKFLGVYNPVKSFQTLAIDADIALNHVFTIARHLVLWGKACIIYPLCETNVYILAPTASIHFQSKYMSLFTKRFQLNLTKVLSYFSTPVRLGDYQSPTGPFFGNENKLVEILIWMLQHRFLVQHHTYVYFIPNNTDDDVNTIKKMLFEVLESVAPVADVLFELKNFPQCCQDVLKTVSASTVPEDLTLFIKLLKYFDGGHHLEEMMYRENLLRFELITILDKFKPLLLTSVREDTISSAFCIPR